MVCNYITRETLPLWYCTWEGTRGHYLTSPTVTFSGKGKKIASRGSVWALRVTGRPLGNDVSWDRSPAFPAAFWFKFPRDFVTPEYHAHCMWQRHCVWFKVVNVNKTLDNLWPLKMKPCLLVTHTGCDLVWGLTGERVQYFTRKEANNRKKTFFFCNIIFLSF